jgi:hypothetical protein
LPDPELPQTSVSCSSLKPPLSMVSILQDEAWWCALTTTGARERQRFAFVNAPFNASGVYAHVPGYMSKQVCSGLEDGRFGHVQSGSQTQVKGMDRLTRASARKAIDAATVLWMCILQR